jgi:hypothetical protein
MRNYYNYVVGPQPGVASWLHTAGWGAKINNNMVMYNT